MWNDLDWCMDLHSQKAYWDRVAEEKRFQHPLRTDWLASHGTGPNILDCGCGYGRLLGELAERGYRCIVGTDFSERMLKRCIDMHPNRTFSFVQTDGHTFPFRDRCFDAVLLFTLLTCMPRDSEQLELMTEVSRVLRPGGLVYISDLLLNRDARNIDRYQQFANEFGTYGVFRLPEGVAVRHHSAEWIRSITANFTQLKYERFTVRTMNGNQSEAFQYLGRLSPRRVPCSRVGNEHNREWLVGYMESDIMGQLSTL
jgi:ubiquinone/menaquinone biosynthesis C-methylase UbiE